MKKITAFFLSFMLVVGIAGLTQAAKKNQPEALANIYYSAGCEELPPVNLVGTALNVDWHWDGGTIQTKFGGDAVYLVDFSIDGEPQEPIVVKIELDLLELLEEGELLEEDSAVKLIYSCSDMTLATGSCKGSALPLESAFDEAIAFETGETGVLTGFTRIYVKVKAMNPGGDTRGRQNYPLVDVCDPENAQPVPVIVETEL